MLVLVVSVLVCFWFFLVFFGFILLVVIFMCLGVELLLNCILIEESF